jgi:hypothetical protein
MADNNTTIILLMLPPPTNDDYDAQYYDDSTPPPLPTTTNEDDHDEASSPSSSSPADNNIKKRHMIIITAYIINKDAITISSPVTNENISSIHFDATTWELLTRFVTNLCLHCGDICDGSEFNVENSDDISSIIDLCPHNYVDICDDSGSVNRNFDDGFSAIELCQHDEASCDDSKVGIPLAASKLVNDDTTPSTHPLPTQQSCQYCRIMRLIQGKGGNPCKTFFPLFMNLIE